MDTTSRNLLAASIAGLIATIGLGTLSAQAETPAAGDTSKVPCYGINKCKGTGACSGKGHTCSGKNACAGQAFLKIDEETCLKIKDGRLTPEPTQS